MDKLIAGFSSQSRGEKVFVDNPKVHLHSTEVRDGVLSFHTCPAMYSHNAAISLDVGNALYELSLARNLNDEMGNIKRVEKVIAVLSALGLKPRNEGIDFSLGKSAIPQTLGVSGIVLTCDGYLLQALQGSKNMTSGGDYVPAISGSADPLEGTVCAFDPVRDFYRGKNEEQSTGPVCYYQILGVFQSLHRLGKPDVMVAAVLHETLAEILGKQKSREHSWELPKQIANATFIGDGVAEIKPDFGDSLTSCAKIAERTETAQFEHLHLGSGIFPFRLAQPGVISIIDQVRGVGNHVNRAALAAFLMSGLGQE